MTIKSVTLALTGASGIPYAFRLLDCFIKRKLQVYLLFSNAAQVVSALEMEMNLPSKLTSIQSYLETEYGAGSRQIQLCGQQQWTAPIASGSGVADAMVVCPCSSGCLSAVASGASDNLIERAADVSLKERKPLILVHRETPLSQIHLENMLRVSRAGATVMPASPGFYHQPKTIDDMVDYLVQRICLHIGFDPKLLPSWGDA